jgi:orotidine-5'-phosphate decarboxylase
MMKRAVDTGITVYAVTVLTSLTEHDCQDYYNRDTIDQVVRLAGRAAAAGVHGIVSSPQELAPLRKMFPANPLLVTPGTRSPGVAAGSQKRITTPLEAIRAGCDQLVVGSEITKDYDPIAAYIRLTDSIK